MKISEFARILELRAVQDDWYTESVGYTRFCLMGRGLYVGKSRVVVDRFFNINDVGTDVWDLVYDYVDVAYRMLGIYKEPVNKRPTDDIWAVRFTDTQYEENYRWLKRQELLMDAPVTKMTALLLGAEELEDDISSKTSFSASVIAGAWTSKHPREWVEKLCKEMGYVQDNHIFNVLDLESFITKALNKNFPKIITPDDIENAEKALGKNRKPELAAKHLKKLAKGPSKTQSKVEKMSKTKKGRKAA